MVPITVFSQKSHTILLQFFHSSFMVLVCPDVKLVLFTEVQIMKLIDDRLVGQEWETVLKVDKLPDPPPGDKAKEPAQDPVKDPEKDPAKDPQKEPEGYIYI